MVSMGKLILEGSDFIVLAMGFLLFQTSLVLWDAEGFLVWVGYLLKIADFLLEIFNRLVPLDDCVLSVLNVLLLGDFILEVLNILALLGHRLCRLDQCFSLLKFLVLLLLTVIIRIKKGLMTNISE